MELEELWQKVNVILDFTKKDIKEIYSRGSSRSQQVIENTSNASGLGNNTGGIAGADNNIQPQQLNDGSKLSSNSESSNTVYKTMKFQKTNISKRWEFFTNIRKFQLLLLLIQVF